MKKLIVISAPSGAGKTSIVHHLLKKMDVLDFSISACSRKKRSGEKDGVDYNFLTKEEFLIKIDEGAFLEWEEVYTNQYYGTLKSEVSRLWDKGKVVIFDIDVIGGLNIKNQYLNDCLSVFIMPPSIEVLEKRLKNRAKDSDANIKKRISKAEIEISKSDQFDYIVENVCLRSACDEVERLVKLFLKD